MSQDTTMDDTDRPRQLSTSSNTSAALTRRSSYASDTSRRPVRPQPSAFRLRRLGPSRAPDGDAADADNPQHVRSMLDVDGDGEPGPRQPAPFRLRRAGSKSNPEQKKEPSANPQNVRSMLDVDNNDQPAAQEHNSEPPQEGESQQRSRHGRFMRIPVRRRRVKADGDGNQTVSEDEYDEGIIDLLDVVDPEVSTLSSITNVQNSLFVPSLGRFVNRRPTFNLTRVPRMPGAFPSQENVAIESPGYTTGVATPEIPVIPETRDVDAPPSTPKGEKEESERPSLERIPSTMTDRFYAVRPPNTSLADWSDEDLAELNDHVRHMLHSRRSAFKRGLRAFGQYVRKPLGFFVTLYATLITLFGLAWVLFLIGWIYVGPKERQLYVINVIDNVLVALFAIVGDGMIPWRAVDTYHMIYIARYHHLTWKLREKMAVPDLKDKNDLPSEPVVSGRDEQRDLEAARHLHSRDEFSVLTPKQQENLDHHQTKFANSHTFYKPHETETHHAFPLRLLVAIVVLLDCHSCFQLALGLCTWIIPYTVRPSALTATILSCSIAVNTTAGILISVGDRRTRKKDVVERIFRQELTEEAMRRIKEKKEKEAAREAEREAENNRLEKIDEGEEGHSRTSFTLPKPRDIIQTLRQTSDDSSSKTKRSAEQSRKSLDRVGRFDVSVPASSGASLWSSTDLRLAGSFPEED